MRLLVTPSFVRAAKRLYSSQKADLDEAVRTISSDPEIGEAKVGDLSGVRVYKFRLSKSALSVGLPYSRQGQSETVDFWGAREFLS